jgi:putative PIN family toxin of toxin-antitoxin system
VVASAFILEEFRRNLVKKFGATGPDASAAADLLRSRFTLVDPKPLEAPACRDPDDDVVLATAVAGSSELLVTGDRDLLDLRSYGQLRIVSPGDFWREEANR